ncbi:hypothetical protein M758_1G057000 [Ceratodon purpureus]|nr:hypothetical protein KC19_1G058700 [Ceratodon purpureus]KAG0628851.1 hypothetical protein M758_1G057000 [Ceratodon purpureus]
MSEPVDPRLRHGTVRTLVQDEAAKVKSGNEADSTGGIQKSTDIATAKPSDVETSGFVTTPEISRSNSVDWIRGNG